MFEKVISWADAVDDGDLWISMHQLRKQEFVDRLGYDVPEDDGLEYDQYDTPAARYAIAYNDDRRVIGTMRLTPTLKPYMLKDLWPELLPPAFVPNKSIREASRIVINKTDNMAVRKEALMRVLTVSQKFGIDNNISSFIGVMYPGIWRAAILRNGCPATKIAQIKQGDKTLQSGSVPVSEEAYRTMKNRITDFTSTNKFAIPSRNTSLAIEPAFVVSQDGLPKTPVSSQSR